MLLICAVMENKSSEPQDWIISELTSVSHIPFLLLKAVLVCVTLFQSCLTLCDPVDYSPPGSSVHGILQARILEWVAMPSPRGSSLCRDPTCISYVYPELAGVFFFFFLTTRTTSETLLKARNPQIVYGSLKGQELFLLMLISLIPEFVKDFLLVRSSYSHSQLVYLLTYILSSVS